MKAGRTLNILAVTLHIALAHQRNGKKIDEQFISDRDIEARKLAMKYPGKFKRMSLDLEEPPLRPDQEITVQFTADGDLRRVLGPLHPLVEARAAAIARIVASTVHEQEASVGQIVEQFADWMRNHRIVRAVGAGRALLAVSLPANRLAHGGATVWILGDRAPLPNSRLGGGMLAASASGKTPQVLQIMEQAKNRDVTVIGISKRGANTFKRLCNHFLGIDFERAVKAVQLRALGDIEEYAISELLDALVVAAGLEIGVNFWLGHEDLGPSGPWNQYQR